MRSPAAGPTTIPSPAGQEPGWRPPSPSQPKLPGGLATEFQAHRHDRQYADRRAGTSPAACRRCTDRSIVTGPRGGSKGGFAAVGQIANLPCSRQVGKLPQDLPTASATETIWRCSISRKAIRSPRRRFRRPKPQPRNSASIWRRPSTPAALSRGSAWPKDRRREGSS